MGFFRPFFSDTYFPSTVARIASSGLDFRCAMPCSCSLACSACNTSKSALKKLQEKKDKVLKQTQEQEEKAKHDASSKLQSEVAREELEHFELVLDHLDERGIPFERLSPSPYAGKLLTIMRQEEPGRLVDMLLCCAMIEARSCERMGLLADALTDPDLSALYRGLLESEARHHMLYIDLACLYDDEKTVRARLDIVAKHEAEIIFDPSSVPRMHN